MEHISLYKTWHIYEEYTQSGIPKGEKAIKEK